MHCTRTEGIEQRNFECPQSDDVLGFINMCKAHFRSMAAPRSREEEQQWQQVRGALPHCPADASYAE
jgi:hypothetical protein